MDANTISATAELIEALPNGPYITVETPFPALEQIAGRDINLGSTFGDINLPFGEDFLDISITDDNSTHVSDILDINIANGVVAEDAPEIPEIPWPPVPEDNGNIEPF